jgi:hypothetical protein
MLNYLNALKYPITNIKSFVIGALLTLFSILFIPFLLVQGYVVKIIRETNKGSDFMPEWEDWKTLLFDGFFVFAIEVAYLLPSLLLYTLATLTTAQSLTSAISSGTILDIGITAVVLILISSIIMILALIVLPVAIVNYALTKEFKSAFDIVGIVKTILMNPLNYVLTLVIGFIVMLLFLLTAPITSIVLGALLFYPVVFMFRTVAEWFTEIP